jgi:hypothetical protein
MILRGCPPLRVPISEPCSFCLSSLRPKIQSGTRVWIGRALRSSWNTCRSISILRSHQLTLLRRRSPEGFDKYRGGTGQLLQEARIHESAGPVVKGSVSSEICLTVGRLIQIRRPINFQKVGPSADHSRHPERRTDSPRLGRSCQRRRASCSKTRGSWNVGHRDVSSQRPSWGCSSKQVIELVRTQLTRAIGHLSQFGPSCLITLLDHFHRWTKNNKLTRPAGYSLQPSPYVVAKDAVRDNR